MISPRMTARFLLILVCTALGAHAADTSTDRLPLKNSSGAVMLQSVETKLTWKEARLPGATVQTLRKIAAKRPPSSPRREVSLVLLSGPDRDARSRAATALATELGRPLYRVDLSAVAGKYIGETEKNLARVFDAADASGAILLFDEADALFGKRTEPKDAHDRYANQEVSYLLTRIEKHHGLVLITSSSPDTIDPALLQRFRHTVLFPQAGDDKSG